MAGEWSSDALRLSWRDCYIGQRVFWVMWIEADYYDGQKNGQPASRGWWWYKAGRSPEVWSGTVKASYKNGTIVLDHYGKAHSVFSCEMHAVEAAYVSFCDLHLSRGWPYGSDFCCLGEASRVLGLLAEIEYGIHNAVGRIGQRRALHGR